MDLALGGHACLVASAFVVAAAVVAEDTSVPVAAAYKAAAVASL